MREKLTLAYEVTLVTFALISVIVIWMDSPVLRFLDLVVWGFFFVDVSVRFVRAPSKWDYVKRNPFDLIAIIPFDALFQLARIARLMHNAIDRFTGGVRNRVLYEEESLYGGAVEIPIALHVQRLHDPHGVRPALKAALDDLCGGRLGLGSRTTTGNGFFTGEITGRLRDWLAEDHSGNAREAA